jgi:PAS domain S-box-containing protein
MKRAARSSGRAGSSRAGKAPKNLQSKGLWISKDKFVDLQERLRESQETLEAIRGGEVDAVVVAGPRGNQIYTLTGAEQPYRVYVERMQEGAVTVSVEGLILYANHRFASMARLPLERVIGSEITRYLSAETWEAVSPVFLKTETVVKHETALKREHGAPLVVNLTASHLPLLEQTVMCLVITDLTSQRENEKFRLAKEVAEKANASKDTFLAALSHELRTPLTPVLMMAAMLESDDSLPASKRQALKMIRRNIELEARLIDDLLDLTRVAHGKMELHTDTIDLHVILNQAVEICERHLREKKHKLQIFPDATHAIMEGDPVRLQQAMWNLIRNAVKFTPEHGCISISTSNPVPGRLRFAVQDNGIGFDPAIAGKMFEAFEQGGREITRQFGGLGLGLVITRSIVEAHGGTVAASSDGPGRGATVSFELPLTPAETKTEAVAAPQGSAQMKPRSRRILLVEDHADTRSSLEFLLRQNHHEVLGAGSAEEALQLAANHKFDLVISDLGLPDKSGLELMRQLRDEFGLKGVGVTGYGMEENIKASQAAGFIFHLVKPIRFDQLKQVINQIP